MRSRGVQPMPINDQMPIISNLNMFATHCYHAFDIELVLLKALDAFSGKNNNLTAFGGNEIIAQPIDEQMISRNDPKADNWLAFMDKRTRLQPGTKFQRLFSVIRWEPDYVGILADHQGLPNFKDQEADWRINCSDFSIRL